MVTLTPPTAYTPVLCAPDRTEMGRSGSLLLLSPTAALVASRDMEYLVSDKPVQEQSGASVIAQLWG